MNVAIVTARILFGSIFVVFGLNGFLHFLPQPPVPEAAGAFFGGLAATGYMVPLVFGAQLVGGSAMRSSRRWSRSGPSAGRSAMRSDWWKGTGNSLGPIPLGPRKQLWCRALLAGSVAALALSARAGASTWALDPNATRVEFSVRNLSVGYVHGGFHLASGTVQLNAEDVLHSTIEAAIDAGSIDTDEPKRDAHLRSADFLDVGVYPTIAFKSTRIERAGDDRWTVTGQLTLHGTTHDVVLDVQRATLNGDRATAHASTTIDRRDFGITYGDFAIGKEVAITIDTVGIKKVTDGTGGPATPPI